MPRSYLTDDTSVYLFGNECLVLGNILQNRKRIEGESKCLKLLENLHNYSDQVFFYSYKSVYGNNRLSGSGDSMKMKGWNDTILAVKDVVIVAVGKYTNSDDIYTDDVYKKSYEKRNVFYNLK